MRTSRVDDHLKKIEVDDIKNCASQRMVGPTEVFGVEKSSAKELRVRIKI